MFPAAFSPAVVAWHDNVLRQEINCDFIEDNSNKSVKIQISVQEFLAHLSL